MCSWDCECESRVGKDGKQPSVRGSKSELPTSCIDIKLGIARPLKIERFSGQTAATQAVSKGAADVTITDTPIATWAVRNSKGKLTLSGKPFGVAPYGIAIAKGSGLTGPLNKAMNELIANGVYDNILLKWGLNAGAIEKSVINSAKK